MLYTVHVLHVVTQCSQVTIKVLEPNIFVANNKQYVFCTYLQDMFIIMFISMWSIIV